MIGRTRRSWALLKSSKPGDRFQVHYYYRKQRRRGRPGPGRSLNIAVGSTLVIVSFFFGWAPGPGLLTFVIGLMLVGGEVLAVARFLDWAEVRLWKLARLARDVWASSAIGKVLMVFVVALIVAAFGRVIYALFFGG